MLRQTSLAESAFDDTRRSSGSTAAVSPPVSVGTRRPLRRAGGRASAQGRGLPEYNLIFRLARPRPVPITSRDLDDISDWDRLLRIASEENAIIALRACLKEAKVAKLPAGLERYVAMGLGRPLAHPDHRA